MNKNTVIKCGAVLLIGGLCGGIMYHDHNQVVSNYRHAHTEQIETADFNHKKSAYTPTKFKTDYDKSKPNLYKKLAGNKKQLKKGLSLAFNDCTDTSGFNKHQSRIKQLLGNNFGGNVLNKVRPQTSQNSSKPQSISNSLDDLDISYGQFDDSDDTIPINLFVHYTTPRINLTAGAGDTHLSSNNTKVYKGTVLYQLDYNLNTGNMTVEHSEQQMK